MRTISDCRTTAVCPNCGNLLNLFSESQTYRCPGCGHTFSGKLITAEDIRGDAFKVTISDVPAFIVSEENTRVRNKVILLQKSLGCQAGLCGWDPETGDYTLGFISVDGKPVIPSFADVHDCLMPILSREDL